MISCPWGETEAQRGAGTGQDTMQKSHCRTVMKSPAAPSWGWAWLVRSRYLSEPVTEDPQNSGSWPSPLRCNLKYPVHVSQASSKVLCSPAPPSLNVPQMTRSSKPHSKRYINLLPSGLDYADSYFHSSTDQKHQIQPQKKKISLTRVPGCSFMSSTNSKFTLSFPSLNSCTFRFQS